MSASSVFYLQQIPVHRWLFLLGTSFIRLLCPDNLLGRHSKLALRHCPLLLAAHACWQSHRVAVVYTGWPINSECRSAIRRGPNGLATCDQSILGSVFRSSATLAVYRLLHSVGIGPTVATQFDSLGLLKDRSIRTIAHPLGGWTPSTKSSNTARACFIGNLQVNVARLKPSPIASRPIMLSTH